MARATQGTDFLSHLILINVDLHMRLVAAALDQAGLERKMGSCNHTHTQTNTPEKTTSRIETGSSRGGGEQT